MLLGGFVSVLLGGFVSGLVGLVGAFVAWFPLEEEHWQSQPHGISSQMSS